MKAGLPQNRNSRLMLSGKLPCELLQNHYQVSISRHEQTALTFWDTFEWGMWFGGYLLYSSENIYHLCKLKDGWLGDEICSEVTDILPRFKEDFKTGRMQKILTGILGIRGLATVFEGTLNQLQLEIRNDYGKIICRLDCSTISSKRAGNEKPPYSCCRVTPLMGYEAESGNIIKLLARYQTDESQEGPLELLFKQMGRKPCRYTLRPVFGLDFKTPAREATGKIVRSIFSIALSNLPGLLSDIDTEFLHDYRICIRKIRSLLALIKGVYPDGAVSDIRTQLGEMARSTNRLRDLDVYLLARGEYLEMLPPQLRPALYSMFDEVAAERKLEVKNLVLDIQSAAYQNTIEGIESFFSETEMHGPSLSADIPVGQLVFRQMYRRYKKICRMARAIDAYTADEMLHQLRIECKKLRYLMEFFRELIDDTDIVAMQKILRSLQEILGEFNDTSVQQKTILGYFNSKRDDIDIALGIGGLVSILYYRRHQSRRRIVKVLNSFCGKGMSVVFKRNFKQKKLNPKV